MVVATPSQERARAAYRPDIDGLRAVAVAAVVLYHFAPAAMPGGYVGVDVFFVISGYLITGIVHRELRAGTFSMARFYERRARRILPALAAVLVASSVAAYIWFLPEELRGFAKQLLAAALSLSNLFYWRTFDYFDFRPDAVPLLHTWSLAVEEQFYLAAPLAMIWLHRSASQRPAWLGLGIASLLASAWVVQHDPKAAFYLPHLRAWELIVGVALALDYWPRLTTTRSRQLAGLSGGLLVVGSSLIFDDELTFPGAWALLPCLGTGLLIASGGAARTAVGAVLEHPVLTFLGRISYSLYLWHWPVLIFARAAVLLPSTWHPSQEALVLAAVSLALAWLSWRFVEQPFRHASVVSTRRLAWTLGSAAVICLAFGVRALNGLPERLAPEARQLAQYLDYTATTKVAVRDGQCFISSGHQATDFDRATCLPTVRGRARVVLVGDSHAAHLWPGLSRIPDVSVSQVTASGCKPVLPLTGEPRCVSVLAPTFEALAAGDRPDLLVLAARWFDDDVARLTETLRGWKQSGLSVLLIGPIVEYRQPLPRLLTIGGAAGAARQRQPSVDALDRTMARLARDLGIPYASLVHLICPTADTCVTSVAGVPMQFDYGHLTIEGSAVVADGLWPAMQAAMRSGDRR